MSIDVYHCMSLHGVFILHHFFYNDIYRSYEINWKQKHETVLIKGAYSYEWETIYKEKIMMTMPIYIKILYANT